MSLTRRARWVPSLEGEHLARRVRGIDTAMQMGQLVFVDIRSYVWADMCMTDSAIQS